MNIDLATVLFEKTFEHLNNEFAKLQAGRASTALVDDVRVDAYGSMQPLKSVAIISLPDNATIRIQPYDKSLFGCIEKGIIAAQIGLAPCNKGDAIYLTMPALTEDSRRDLVKKVHKMTEDAKISIRQGRQEVLNKIKSAKTNSEITEDEQKGLEKKLQEKVDEANLKTEEMMKKKEKEVMTV